MQQPGIPRVRAIKRDASAAPLDPSVSMIVHDRPWDINVPKSHFYELILQDRHSNTISKLSAKYQFCAIRTADTRDGKLTTRGIYPWVVHRLSIVCPPFVHRLCPPSLRRQLRWQKYVDVSSTKNPIKPMENGLLTEGPSN